MADWSQLFNNPNFMPHGHCYLWQPSILWTHVLSDATIALAYYAIPVVLALLLWRRRHALPFKGVIALFVAFIFLCGTTHLLRIYVTWVPAYELEGWLKAATAIISLMTAIVFVPILPVLLKIPNYQTALARSDNAVAALKEKNNEMEVVYTATMDREDRILELKSEVNELLAQLGHRGRYNTGETGAF
ncbi:MAG: hypothetical protein KTR32_33195 [Granulosicoccus sp.]|nr:hypothetical protein [Granulosicoccus sp.]